MAVDLLRQGVDGGRYPALRAIGDGPQALTQRYPAMQEIVFTCGDRTLGNAGHSNALWTFLMPFSRFFGHYSGQIYKIDELVGKFGGTRRGWRKMKGIDDAGREWHWYEHHGVGKVGLKAAGEADPF